MFYVKATDGTKIAVYDYMPYGKETVVFLHGWPLSNKIFEYQVNLLTANGYRVITLDIRGFGNSDAPAGGYSYDQMAQDLYDIVCAIGLSRFTLTGFSMGGAIALRYMKNYEGYGVNKLILLAAAAPSFTQRPGYPYGLSRQNMDQLIYQAMTDRPQLVHDFIHDQFFARPHTDSLLDWFEDIALSASGIGTIQAGIALRDEYGKDDLAYVNVPTIIIHGGRDQVVSQDLAALQHKGIRNSRLITLPDSGHGIMYDELQQFNRTFLTAIRND